jgi:hypothetical protein
MVARESEPESSDYSEEAGPSPALYGKLRTRLRWECNPGVLHLDVSQQAETIRSLECRFKGRINTKKGSVQHRCGLAHPHTGLPSKGIVLVNATAIMWWSQVRAAAEAMDR